MARVAIRTALAAAILLLAGSLAAVLIFRSGWFHERLRERVISEIETSTGGRVEMGDFSFNWEQLTATIAPLILHGTEPAGDPPLLTVRSVTLGLRIVSMLERKVDLASLYVDQPVAQVVFYPNGGTNLPSPRVRDPKNWAEDVVNFGVGRYEIVDGVLDYSDRIIPLNFHGEDLSLKMARDPGKAGYRGELAFRRSRVMTAGFGPLDLDVAGAFSFDQSSIDITRLRVSTKDSRVDLNGVLTDVRSPGGTLNVKSAISIREMAAIFHMPAMPLARAGKAALEGQLAIALAAPSDFTFAGRINAQGLACAVQGVKIEDANLRAVVSMTADKLALSHVMITALGATINGTAELLHRRDFHFDGDFEGLTLAEAAKFATNRPLPWNGNLSGNLDVDAVAGQPAAKVHARVAITPIPGVERIEGQIDAVFDQNSGTQSSGTQSSGTQTSGIQTSGDQAVGTIHLGDSHIATAATRIDISGTLNGTLNVRAHSTNLDDLLPALALLDQKAPKALPVKLNRGSADFEGTLSGAMLAELTPVVNQGAPTAANDARIRGQLTLSAATVEGHPFDRFSAEIDATRREVQFTGMTITRGNTEIEGAGSITARKDRLNADSFDNAAISAQLGVRNAPLSEAATEFGNQWIVSTAVSGTAGATIHLSGSTDQPEAEIAVQIENPAAFGEHFDRLRADIRYSPTAVEVTAGDADAYGGKLRFQGSFQHRMNAGKADWQNGTLRFDVAAQGIAVSRIDNLSKLAPDAGLRSVVNTDTKMDAKAAGTARLVNDELTLDSINGAATAHGLIWNQQPLGDVVLNAETRGGDVAIRLSAKIRDVNADAQGSWKLAGDYPGSATVRFSRATVATLRGVLMAGGPLAETELPFEGFIDGARATVSVALGNPRDFRAELTVDQVQLNPKPAQTLRLGAQTPDIVVKNSQPVTIEISSKEARIRSAEFTARDTTLEVTGAMPLNAASGAALSVRGSVNLIVLQLLNPDLVARGNATVQASVRGSLKDPQLNGRMELKDASLYLSDLPNGVDKANGAVIFDRNRATIEKLTAETGGGKVTFTGFIGFGSTLVYRLQAVAEKVRVRYPEDVSTTFNSTLALNGTSDASTVSGVVTIMRASFTPRADFAQILAQAGRPVSAPVAASDYVRGIQFDVRIESGPNFEFQTSLARNLEAAIDLRLRGTPLRPVLLGSVSVNDGEVEMFGNRYTVNRGDIRFNNPVRVDPIFDMELETKARSVTVNIAITGTMQKLNVNYSSDPPMQPREIIALLAVGRTPMETAGLNSTPSTASSTSMNEAGASLIGQAISAQLSSRLQRFFGSSRVKIDPTLSGVEYLPQARITVEQQVSNDITLTYITNLNRTEEQIVEIEWDFSRRWSAVATREASGLFGIDFTYRKRFQ
jgi:translocation and assembly module TamB